MRHPLYRAKPKIGGEFMRWLTWALKDGGCQKDKTNMISRVMLLHVFCGVS